MIWKKAAIAAMFVLGCVSGLYAKDYKFTVDAPLKAGANEMVVGEYKLSVQGSIAIVTNTKTNKSFTTMVKTETSPKKFDATSLETTTRDGQKKLEAINLGGSDTRLILP